MWKRSVELSRYAVGGAMEIGESRAWSGSPEKGRLLVPGPVLGEAGADSGHGGRAGKAASGAKARTEALAPRVGGDHQAAT